MSPVSILDQISIIDSQTRIVILRTLPTDFRQLSVPLAGKVVPTLFIKIAISNRLLGDILSHLLFCFLCHRESSGVATLST